VRKLIIAAAAAGALGVAMPAFAQSNVDQLSVTVGGGDDGRPLTLSRTVDYGDLNLRDRHDQDVLRERVADAARSVCDELGQDRPNFTNLGSSCQDRAVDGALPQVRVAVADAMNGSAA
jgi:UrcA family protein